MSTTSSNRRVYGGQAPLSGVDYRLWMAMHDVNILGVESHNDSIIYTYEFGYIDDNMKRWAKNMYIGSGDEDDLKSIISIVQYIREDIDEEQ